jgi:hypothetical protein
LIFASPQIVRNNFKDDHNQPLAINDTNVPGGPRLRDYKHLPAPTQISQQTPVSPSRTVALACDRETAEPIRACARQINERSADGATRCVYEHPADDLASKIELPAERP